MDVSQRNTYPYSLVNDSGCAIPAHERIIKYTGWLPD